MSNYFKGETSIHPGPEEVLYDDAILIKEVCEKADVDVSFQSLGSTSSCISSIPCPETDAALEEIGNIFREN